MPPRAPLVPLLLLPLSASCQLATDFTLTPVAESSAALCGDGRDNDFDGLGDCQDWNCLLQPVCCDIPEVLLEDYFVGPACADEACAGATCAALECGPDAATWHAWPCPFPRVCDGALRLDKTRCYPAGVLGHTPLPLVPGLSVSVGLLGRPEVAGYTEAALTLKDEPAFPGSLDPCGRSQEVRGFAAVRQEWTAGGYRLVASFLDLEIGASSDVAAVDEEHVASLSIDDARRVVYALDGVPFADSAEPLPDVELPVRLALTGLTETARFTHARVLAGRRCHDPRSFSPARGTLEASVALAGDRASATAWDRDDVFNAGVDDPGPPVSLYYAGCRRPDPDTECGGLAVALGHASGTIPPARDPSNPLYRADELPGVGLGPSSADLSLGVLRGGGERAGYLSVGTGAPITRVLLGPTSPALPVLAQGQLGAWDASRVCCATAVEQGGTVYLWYAGKGAGEEPFQIGLATSADGVELERHGPPVVEVGQRGDFDARGLLHPAVAWDGSLRLFRMWYVGVDFFGQTSVGYAVSVDGVTWKKAPGGAVLDARALGLTRLGGTEVWLDPDGRLRLWLDGATLDEPRRRIFELKNDGALAP